MKRIFYRFNDEIYIDYEAIQELARQFGVNGLAYSTVRSQNDRIPVQESKFIHVN